jgi:UDP-GlcNAc:undecaprenyl-phosphate GlcNAc-1-phosphate transferase
VRAFFLLILAIAVSMLVIPMAWRLAPRLGMVDQPDERKVHVTPVPRVGGWGITLGALVPLLLLEHMDPLFQSFVIGAGILFVFGAWDDAKQISHWPKFLGQGLATAGVVFYGGLYVTRLPFIDGEVFSQLGGQLFTMVAMIGVINAINHSDGLDGLAGGETLLSMVVIAFMGYLADSPMVVDIALATIGGIAGFLRYNTHPARVFMGDAGSQFLGFALSFAIVYLVQVANSATSAALPLLLLGLPLADIISVFYLRVSGGMNWFKATRNHVHHRLLDLGFSHYSTVVIIYMLQAYFVRAAVVLRYEADLLVTLAYVLVIITLFVTLTLLERRRWQASDSSTPQWLRAPESLLSLIDKPWLRRLPLLLVCGSVSAFLAVSSVVIHSVPPDFAWLALVLALALATSLAWAVWRDLPVLLLVGRTAVYVTMAFTVYLLVANAEAMAALNLHWVNGYFVALALAVGIAIRFTVQQKFGTTPTDYLIVIGVVAVAFVNRMDRLDMQSGAAVHFITYVIVLFYSCELIFGQIRNWRLALVWPAMLTLLVLAGRGFLAGA